MSSNDIIQGNREVVAYDAASAPLADGPRITFTGCNTGQTSCAGVANFQNSGNQVASFSVWFGNGVHGRSNFVLQPHQTHGMYVQTGDTWSWVWGSTTVPDGAPRYWINVG